MNNIASSDYLNGLRVPSQKTNEDSTEKKEELGQDAFLKLMITQMENQNPLDPQDNSEFVAQLAQFSQVEGLDKLNKSFDGFSSSFISNQALQASSLVGTKVSVATDQSVLTENSYVGGSVNIPNSSNDVKLSVYSEQGALLHEIPLGSQPKGDMVFRWDGSRIEVNGKLLDWKADSPSISGNFKFVATAEQDGKPEQLSTYLTANVNSVTVGSNNKLILNLAGVGKVNIDDVKHFN